MPDMNRALFLALHPNPLLAGSPHKRDWFVDRRSSGFWQITATDGTILLSLVLANDQIARSILEREIPGSLSHPLRNFCITFGEDDVRMSVHRYPNWRAVLNASRFSRKEPVPIFRHEIISRAIAIAEELGQEWDGPQLWAAGPIGPGISIWPGKDGEESYHSALLMVMPRTPIEQPDLEGLPDVFK